MSTLKVNAIEKKDADQTLTVKDATLTGATITTGTFPAGVIIQVVQNTVSTEKTDSSNTWVADDLYVNITPFKASSKILIQMIAGFYQGSGGRCFWNIYESVAGGTYTPVVSTGSGLGVAQTDGGGGWNVSYLASPSYTVGQQLSYRLYFKTYNSVAVQMRNATLETNVAIAMEVAG